MNPTFYTHVAICTVLILLAALVLGTHPFKKKKRLVLAAPADLNLWTAGDYYMFLNSLIRASKSLEELQKNMPLIDGYFDKCFRVPISTIDRKRYYSRLLESYCQKENELMQIPIELCKN
jgi:hypothetical protein